MITFNRADLDFLLRQVTINYLAPDPLNPGQFIPTTVFNYSALANAVDPSGLREVSGANNNLVGGFWDASTQTWVPGPNTTWGQANQPFLNQSIGQSVASAPEGAYNTPGGPVTDTDPRLISDLVATMFTTGPNANPAAAAAATNGDPNAVFGGLQVNGAGTAFMANAGVLGGGRYNGWFVSFGQFFDHGLDFVLRDPDPTATVTINLSPNDPLFFNDGPGGQPDVTSITVRRADVANVSDAGGDGVFGTTDDNGYSAGADGIQGNADDTYAKAKYINNTGLLIDQSQTYGSHQSVNALIREYDANGRPTGRIVSGNTAVLDTPDTADDVGANSLATWADIKTNAARIGLMLTDADIHDAPVLRVDPAGKLLFAPGANDWALATPWNAFNGAVGPYSAALQDPTDPFLRDANGNVQFTGQNLLIDFNPGQSLDSHIITGDGRANENIGLTAVHHVFHEEHNALVANIKASILATGDAAFIAQWQPGGVWDGEKLYQAARLVTESEYNHIAIDQYVGTLYGALPEFVSYSSDINMGVSLEFSQAVFRLGHSMLTETFNVTDPNTGQNLKLLDMFLNPALYQEIGPAALAQGLTTTLGNEVDEFVTPALQQTLLGQPLDLATINIARGRDVGLPTWNEFRQQVYDQLIQNTNNTNGSALAPYTNWADVGDHLKNTGTLVNMIAAYAHDTGAFNWGIDEARAAYEAGTATLADVRAAAQALYDAYLAPTSGNHAAAVEFMQGAPTYDPLTGQWTFTGADQGFWDIDLWIGGLAERPLFDGPLGTTFSYVMLDFAQRQQDGDRFYYLFRTPMGTHLGNEIIENQFGNLVMDHTGLDHLNGEIFIWANATFTLDDNPNYFNVANETIQDVDGTPMPASAGHLIVAGLGGDDFLVAGLGDDSLYGDAGNDQLYGSQGNDHLFGGDGDDYISDDENDDFISGGAGNDRIFAGPGVIDTVFGDEGDDEIHGGDGIDELLGGTGDDMIYGDGDTDVVFGEEGNDYLEGGDSVDEMQGQEGNDWMRGGVGDDHLMGGDGNDLLEGGVGPTANDGDRMLGQGVLDFSLTNPPDLGFDVVSYEDVDIAITANLDTSNENGTGGLLDTYAGIEGLVGTRFNDNLTGADTDTTTSNGFVNLLVGGAGNDILTGLGGDDFIAGDSVVVKNDLSVYLGPAAAYTTITNWKGTGENRPDFGVNGGLGHFLGDNATAANPDGTADTAVFSGQRSDYAVTLNPDGTLRIVDNRGIDSTAVGDTVMGAELFQFSNGAGGTVTLALSQLLNAAPTDIRWNGVRPSDTALPAAGAIIANLSTVDSDSAVWTYSLQPGSSAGFTVSAAGVVTRTGSAMATNTTYTLTVRSTDALGTFFDKTFTIRTNGNGSTTLNGNGTDDIIYGVQGNDTLNGSAGNDTLFGQSGIDTLDGGDGNDVLTGGAGNDTANGGTGNDTFNYAIGDGADVVDGGTDSDTLNIVGTAAANTLGVVYDGTGLASVAGGSVTSVESITADLQGGVDTLSYAGTLAANGVTVDLVNGTASGFTSIANIENVTGGSGNDTLIGNGNANVLNGGANGGADTLTGDAGADNLNGGAGNDTFIATIGDGNDAYTGGADTDTYDLSATTAAATVDLATGNASSAQTGIDTLAAVENVIGSQGGDVISGNAASNTLNGGAGADIINGGNGADILIGGLGNDIMNGGAGSDTFVLAAGFGADTISGFDANPAGGQDLVNVAALGINAGNFGTTVVISDLGGVDTLVTIDADTITLVNVNWNAVTMNDFVLA